MDTQSLLSRRALLKASSALVATVAVSPVVVAADAEVGSRFTAKIAAFEAARSRMEAVAVALEQAEDAVEAMGEITVPHGLLPNGASPEGWVDLSALSDAGHAERIAGVAEATKQRLCSKYAEALAPGRNLDIAAGIDAMKERSLAALEEAKALRKSREKEAGIPALKKELSSADEALDTATCDLLAMTPVTAAEALEKATWLRSYLHASKGHFAVQEWDALIASIGGARLPSFAGAM